MTRRKKSIVTFHFNPSPGEFGDRWRIDFGDAVFDWVDCLSDAAGFLYSRDYPRSLFAHPAGEEFRRVCDLELSLRGEYDDALTIRKWYVAHRSS